MPITTEFEYIKPKDMDEALHVFSLYREKAKALAGGTDLVVQLKENIAKPEIVVDIKNLEELRGLTLDGNKLKIGALVTFADLIESDLVKTRYPLLWEASLTVASTGVRNRATVAGNICSAVPSADSAPVLAVYDAVVLVRAIRGERAVSIHNWFAGPKKTALAADEIVTGLELPLPEKKHAGCYMKLCRYEGEDLAQGGIAVLAFADNTYRVATCALGPKPARCPKTERLLNGNKLSAPVLGKARKLILSEISPIADIRSSKEYRLHMAEIMLERALEIALARLSGKGPCYGENNIV
ncbi:MAG: FAD-binding protein [Elusimicrobia bacterium GWC2_51_8]|nr:MAG: FAD-binding protein [Elusimicrobia bacterium GWA2_51_34]OGR58430.1 MAG: FAD-binding protein [Elusimicrobia bacterium GWC2_51_8]HAF96115.1 FAD-binding protein [Elusimicrobiota bacterium]HCE97459.1 FAD-binding protein [Elusimicrobiota bacterium]